MKEITGDVWNFYGKENNVICIPTNGDIKRDGAAIMGCGVAAQAKLRISNIEYELGTELVKGNHCHWLGLQHNCLSFPVKLHWKDKADLNLIQQSRDELKIVAETLIDFNFYLPRPGCGNGGLDYKDVRPLLVNLPNNVFIISFEEILKEVNNDWKETR